MKFLALLIAALPVVVYAAPAPEYSPLTVGTTSIKSPVPDALIPVNTGALMSALNGRPIWSTPPTDKDPDCSTCKQTTLMDIVREAEETNLPGDTPTPPPGQTVAPTDAFARAVSLATARVGLVDRLMHSDAPSVSPGELAQIIKRIKSRYLMQPEIAYQAVRVLDPHDHDLTGSVEP